MKILSLSFATLIVLISLFTTPLPVHGGNSPEIRILLDEEASHLVVSGVSFQVQRWEQGGWQTVLGRVRMAAFDASVRGIHLDGSPGVSSSFRIRPLEGVLWYAGRPHRGELYLANNEEAIMVVSHMPLESYLVGVVNGEIDSAWPLEAVKAQVVAARSYAFARMNSPFPQYDLKTDVTDQVYAGLLSENERAAQAVEATFGQVLFKDGEPVQAFYHSSCGGTTASASEIWGTEQPAHISVRCGACEDAPYARWSLPVDAGDIDKTIRVFYPDLVGLRSIGIHRRSSDGRVQTLFAETGGGRVLVDAGEFRRVFGYQHLRSTKFSFVRSRDGVYFSGEGYGHGVGLCQWGARGSAMRGMGYRQILGKYYDGVEVRRAY